MRKYSWIMVVMLIGCIVAFASCKRMEQMMKPALPDAEQVEPTEMPEEMVETPPEPTETMETVEPPAEPMMETEMPVETSPALTSYEYVPDAATLGLWHFDGSNVVDSSQNAIQGMIEGDAQWSSNQDWNKGTKPGHSFSFDGNTLITLGTPDVLNPTSAITIEAWVYPTALSAQWNIIFAKWAHSAAEAGSYHLSLEYGVPVFHIYTEEGVGIAAAEQPVELGRWYHIAGIYDSEQIKIYVDGVEMGSTDHSGDIVYDIADDRIFEDYEVVIGSKHHRVLHWLGLIDEVRISSIARQPEELSPNFAEPTISEVME